MFQIYGSDEKGVVKRVDGRRKDHGIVIVQRNPDDFFLERPHDCFYVADEDIGENADVSCTVIWSALEAGDMLYVSRAIGKEASRLLTQPTSEERVEFADDFAKLGLDGMSKLDWPHDKLMKLLGDVPKDSQKNLAVMVSSDVMGPAQGLHIERLWLAKERLERAGYVVIGAWLVPFRDEEAQKEAHAEGYVWLSTDFRLRVAQLSIISDKLVSVSPWATRQDRKVDHHSMVEALRRNVMSRFAGSLGERSVLPFYVCGTATAKELGLNKGLVPRSDHGVVLVQDPSDDDVYLERPTSRILVADPLLPQMAPLTPSELHAALRRGDLAAVAPAMLPAAARFFLAPTESERRELEVDFDRLGVQAAATTPEVSEEVRDQLKRSFRAWVGPKDVVSAAEVAKLMKALDPTWSGEELDTLLTGALERQGGTVMVDDFIDWVFVKGRSG